MMICFLLPRISKQVTWWHVSLKFLFLRLDAVHDEFAPLPDTLCPPQVCSAQSLALETQSEVASPLNIPQISELIFLITPFGVVFTSHQWPAPGRHWTEGPQTARSCCCLRSCDNGGSRELRSWTPPSTLTANSSNHDQHSAHLLHWT